MPPNMNSNSQPVERAIRALGANVALASFKFDGFRVNFISEGEAKYVLSPMDDALVRKRKASEANN